MLCGLLSQFQNMFEGNTVSTIAMSGIHLQIEIVEQYRYIEMKSQKENIKTQSPLGSQFLFSVALPGISSHFKDILK